MENADTRSPEEVLLAFIAAMNNWEKQCWEDYRKQQTSGYDPERLCRNLERMNAIFAEYCIPKKRPYGRAGAFQNPPEYDPDGETIVEAEHFPGKTIIHTQQHTGLRNKCRYVLIKKGGRWLIDSKQIILADGSVIRAAL